MADTPKGTNSGLAFGICLPQILLPPPRIPVRVSIRPLRDADARHTACPEVFPAMPLPIAGHWPGHGEFKRLLIFTTRSHRHLPFERSSSVVVLKSCVPPRPSRRAHAIRQRNSLWASQIARVNAMVLLVASAQAGQSEPWQCRTRP